MLFRSVVPNDSCRPRCLDHIRPTATAAPRVAPGCIADQRARSASSKVPCDCLPTYLSLHLSERYHPWGGLSVLQPQKVHTLRPGMCCSCAAVLHFQLPHPCLTDTCSLNIEEKKKEKRRLSSWRRLFLVELISNQWGVPRSYVVSDRNVQEPAVGAHLPVQGLWRPCRGAAGRVAQLQRLLRAEARDRGPARVRDALEGLLFGDCERAICKYWR